MKLVRESVNQVGPLENVRLKKPRAQLQCQLLEEERSLKSLLLFVAKQFLKQLLIKQGRLLVLLEADNKLLLLQALIIAQSAT